MTASDLSPFMWGTGASSTQTEGAAPASDYARWEQLGRVPPSGDGNGFGHRFREDFALLASLGLTHHRLSLEWARLEPRQGHHDSEAIEHSREVLTAARDAGLETWVCLHHFSLPGWFADDLGGFTNDRARGYQWPKHVDFVAETFGDLVTGWKPINEPLAFAAGGFLSGSMPPGQADVEQFADALRSTHLANIEAWRLLRSGDQPVATVMNLSPITSAPSSDVPEVIDRARSRRDTIDEIVWGSWISLIRDGLWSSPFGAIEEIPDAAGAFDLIGFSYYAANSVDEHGALHRFPADGPKGPLGDTRFPDGLREVIDRLAHELPDRALLISEVGLGTSPDDPDGDAQRCEYMRSIKAIVDEALAGGVDLRGLFWWTGVDNYEWTHGWDAEFGMIDRDRSPKPSALLAQEWATGVRDQPR
jgi:beta-glucosidase